MTNKGKLTAKAEATNTTEQLNDETAKALDKMSAEVVAIHRDHKTWTVTGRSFIGRDGVQYNAGDKAPKTNITVFGWKLASDLFSVADAQAFAKRADLNALHAKMTDAKSLVTYLNHETRHAVFTALLATPSADVAALVEQARPVKATADKATANPLADLFAL